MSVHQTYHAFSAKGRRRNLTQEKVSSISSVFYESDEGHKGYLSREDVKVAVVSLFGYKPSKYEVNKWMGTVSVDGAGSDSSGTSGLTLEQFVSIMSSKMAAQDEDDEIRQTFLAFDTHCRGFLTLEDLKKVFGQTAPHLPLHVMESSFREIDRDGDGRVSYKDFEYMMKYNKDDGF